MKSYRIQSRESTNKTFKIKQSTTKRDNTFSDKPTPLDFDTFIPWFCLELQVTKNIIVTRTNQAAYETLHSKFSKSSIKSIKSKSRSNKSKLIATKSALEEKRISTAPKISYATSTVDIADAIPVTTYYDKRGRLVQIAIVGSLYPIPRKLIQAFNLCLPFHSGLYKLSIRNGGVCQTILHEISKLLPHSNITEVCLDGSCVPDGNYSILLDRASQIKYLSLQRCGIADEECKRIAEKINIKGPAIKNLLLLDLTSNNIKDDGALALGESLKNNRYLMYLNLSGNNISDIGASYILRYLQEFPLTYDDIKQKRARHMDFLTTRSITYGKFVEEAKLLRLESKIKKDSSVSSEQILTINVPKSRKHTGPSFNFEETTVEDDAERKTKEIIGEFRDPFEEKCIKRKGDCVYAIGNLAITYLNLAYNNLSLVSLRKILNILKYQYKINELIPSTGLVRVVIDGNNVPTKCDELYEINLYLKSALAHCEHSTNVSFTTSSNDGMKNI